MEDAKDNDGSDWESSFRRQEIWVMNTEYRLFGKDGPTVSGASAHVGRLDEMAKCLAAAPGSAAVRLFWADAVISVEGPDLGDWQFWIGKRAPSEQQMICFLLPNIHAAWRGEKRTRTVKEAKQLWYSHGSWDDPAPQVESVGGQPTPGIFVWKNPKLDGEEWWDNPPPEPEPGYWREGSWPLRPTREHVAHFLGSLRTSRWSHVDLKSEESEAAAGLLLEYSGVDLRFLARRPLSHRSWVPIARRPDPEACAMILGGPKGMSEPVKDLIREAFRVVADTPLLEVCLGPREEMAHACVAFMRLQDDAGFFRAAVVDLYRLGREGFESLVAAAEQAMRARLATWRPAKSGCSNIGGGARERSRTPSPKAAAG